MLIGDFTFNVDSGNLGVTGVGDWFAELLIRVRKDGVDVARDQTTITQTAGGTVSCVSNDFGALGSYIDCASPTSTNGNDCKAAHSSCDQTQVDSGRETRGCSMCCGCWPSRAAPFCIFRISFMKSKPCVTQPRSSEVAGWSIPAIPRRKPRGRWPKR